MPRMKRRAIPARNYKPVPKLTWVREVCATCADCRAELWRGDIRKHGALEDHGKVWCPTCGKAHEGYYDMLGVDVLANIPMLGVDAI